MKNMRIPSLSFGDSLRFSKVDAGNLEYVDRSMANARTSSDTTDATLVGKTFFWNDEKV